MNRRHIIAILFVIQVSLGSTVVFAQDENSCDPNTLSEKLKDYAEEIKTADREQIETINGEIDTLFTNYLASCSDSSVVSSNIELVGEV